MTRRTPARPRARRLRGEGRPEGAVLAVADREPQDLPVAGGGDPGRDHDRLADHGRALVGLDVRGVEEHVREGDMVEAPLAEGADDRVELAADPAHLALADPGVDAQGPHEVVDLAGADAVDVRLHHDRPQGAVDPPPRLEQAGQERALAELGDVQLDVARLGGEQPGPAPVAVGRALVGPLVPPGADRLRGLGLDELLEHERHRLAHDVDRAARAHGVEQLGQGRL